MSVDSGFGRDEMITQGLWPDPNSWSDTIAYMTKSGGWRADGDDGQTGTGYPVIPKLKKPLFSPLPVFECRCCGEIITSIPKWKEERRRKGFQWYTVDDMVLLNDTKFSLQEEIKTAQVSHLKECLEELNRKVCAQVFIPPYYFLYPFSPLPQMRPIPIPKLTPKEEQAIRMAWP